MKFNFLSLLILLLIGCDEFGANEYHHMSDDKKIRFSEGDVLIYTSDSGTEKYEVYKIINGTYSDSRSGTCAKPRLDIYDYQAVYLKPVDSLKKDYYVVGKRYDDCDGYPTLWFLETRLIQSLNGSFREPNYDRIKWLDEFDDKITNFNTSLDKLTILNRTYTNVFEYNVKNGKRLAKLYYTRSYGFIGYQLKDGTLFVLSN